MIRRPPRSTLDRSSAASDVYKRQPSTMSFIRPLVVAHSSRCGGAENVLHELVKGLAKRGIEPVVVFPESGVTEQKLRDRGEVTETDGMKRFVETTKCKPERFLEYAATLKDRVHRLVGLIHQRQLNLVITNTAVVFEGALAARLAGVPHVWYVHELLSKDPSLSTLVPIAAFNSLLEYLSDRIVAVSQAVKFEIEQFVTTDKIEVIYTGLDDAAWTESSKMRSDLFGWNETVPTVAFVGTLSERKGLHTPVSYT